MTERKPTCSNCRALRLSADLAMICGHDRRRVQHEDTCASWEDHVPPPVPADTFGLRVAMIAGFPAACLWAFARGAAAVFAEPFVECWRDWQEACRARWRER